MELCAACLVDAGRTDATLACCQLRALVTMPQYRLSAHVSGLTEAERTALRPRFLLMRTHIAGLRAARQDAHDARVTADRASTLAALQQLTGPP